MQSPGSAQIIALLLTLSILFPTQALAKTSEPAQKPDYSQEAVVIEHLSTAYRYERDGTGRREMSLRVKVQSDAGVERFGQLVFPYSSARPFITSSALIFIFSSGTTRSRCRSAYHCPTSSQL